MSHEPRRTETAARSENCRSDALVTSILETIADHRNESLAEVDVQFRDAVDLDALETLYQHADQQRESGWKLSFSVDGLDVTVQSDGSIAVTDSEQ